MQTPTVRKVFVGVTGKTFLAVKVRPTKEESVHLLTQYAKQNGLKLIGPVVYNKSDNTHRVEVVSVSQAIPQGE